MFKNDFLMQRIAELASSVARMLGLKHAQQQAEEDGELNEASLSQLGLPLSLLVQLSPRDLRLRCSSMGEVDVFRAATAGALLTAAAAGYPERAQALHASSLDLLLLAMEENSELGISELRELATLNMDALGADLPPELSDRAARLPIARSR
ncbi:MAG: hypothetical protein ACI9VR_003597 [Cognaticolwellia sp.]|jgi:hypothetical protein